MLFLGLLTLTFTSSEEEKFTIELNQTYEQYALVKEYTNNYYDLKLYAGKIKDKIYYGIYFRNTIPNEYKLKIKLKDKIYILDKTKRGDVLAPAVDLKNANEFSILIFNKDDYYQYGLFDFQNIEVMNVEEFSKLNNVYYGKGNEVNIVTVKSEVKFNKILYVYFFLIFIILVCASIIYYYYKRKKGMFSPELRSSNVFNFKEFINSVIVDLNKEDEIKDVEAKVVDIKKDMNNDNNQENIQVNSTYKWFHYEEEVSNFDIKGYLESLNLPTDYQNATTDEKNKIMLELMHLRKENKITYDDYLNEISKLWKN